MKDIKLIMVDLDETVLENEKNISNKTKESIEKLLDLGIEVVWTTGRYYDAIPKYFIDNPRINYVAASNGAMILDLNTKEVIFSENLNNQTTLAVIDIVNKEAKHLFVISDFEAIIDQRMFEDKGVVDKAFFTTLKSHAKVVDDIYEYIKTNNVEAQKIEMAFDDDKTLKRLYKKVSLLNDLELTSSHSNNFEVHSEKTSKGHALMFLKEKLNLNKSEIMAIGDNMNDISMLEVAGLAVAMNNANSKVKEHADFITDSVANDGFSKVVNKYFK